MMTRPVRTDLTPNTYAYETEAFVKPTGFREYDARWLYGSEINALGVQRLGLALAHIVREETTSRRIVTGHDYRAYSGDVKRALITGLLQGGVHVLDIGLALSPTAYFAQFHLDAPAVAMVTASHNENGWTGVKMGAHRPLTFGPELMGRLKDLVMEGGAEPADGGRYEPVSGVREAYLDGLVQGRSLRRKLKAVIACGNGTAGAFAPEALSRLGVDVVPLHTDLDWTFPNHNPNPEDLAMLHAVRNAVLEHKADIGLAFDGDGDRCGVVDDTGEEIFADKIGVLLARDLAREHGPSKFVVDVKSTGLFRTDPELLKLGVEVEYWKTGHSYIKRRSNEIGALAGFEKSGHFFLNKPVGRGYDDGILSAIAVLEMLDRNPGASMGDLKDSLPKTYQTPTMSPKCADEEKYRVVDAVTDAFVKMKEAGETLGGRKIEEVVTVNGARVQLEGGAWGLVRASSNKPVLVVVCESPNSEAEMRAVFTDVDARLRAHPEVGEYDQRI